MRLLEMKINSSPPQHTDVMIFDGYFMLYLMKNVPVTFDNISIQFLKMICANSANTIILTFDRYIFPSIKDTEHKIRGMQLSNFSISGSEQVRPTDFTGEWKNVNFKEAIVRFFFDHWAEDYMAPYINNKTIYVNADACHKYIVRDGKMIRSIEHQLTCPSHEEADTKIIYHICKLQSDTNVNIRCFDTDILVIIIANMSNIDKNINISMQVGVGNNQRFININHLYETLGSDVSAALPAFHAITGCDFNPAFFRKGKKRPYLMMTKNKEFVNSFIAMSTSSESREDLFDKIQEFVCRLYGFKKINDINEARVATFMRNYKVLGNNNVFRLTNKTIDGSALPPCKVELQQQFLRACYIAQIWAHAHLQVPSGETPSVRL
ncbi:PREDICTED: uncharacterized protein LOC108363375 [Rhagoletis zephyria]|uniref:uncharacterized protein LOC108363375 n=1 Tax=Rhagoletis zephyria TaxID=28612 RepID=UPI0008112C36|nr:PREDICTED: uncharacterized protein LOC108363375 [Rhagoletis zephyria]